jgi:putative methionine-R-sulfoxide reductase with GAF domain
MIPSKPGFDPKMVRNATWSAALLTAAGLLFVIVGYFIAEINSWKDYILLGAPAVLSLTGLVSIALLRRGNVVLGTRLLFVANLILPFVENLFQRQIGLAILLYMVMSSAVLIWRSLPASSRRWAYVSTGIALLAIITTELVNPSFRISPADELVAFISVVTALLTISFIFQAVRETWGSNIRVRLLTSSVGVTVLAIIILGAFVLYRNQQTENTWSTNLQDAVQKQSQQAITSNVQFEAHTADEALSKVTEALRQLADYQASLYAKESFFGQGAYWDGNSKLLQHSEGQYGNAASDPAAIYIPNHVALSPSLIADLNTSLYLDFSAPSLLKQNPDVVAVYYNSDRKYSVYYPNIDLSNLVPADFDPTAQSFYTVATPENDKEHKAVWTKPYQDPAGTGLIVTNSVPVYDQNNRFRGVMSADIQLAKLSEEISAVKFGKTGFAFLIDPDGRVIAMPPAGYELLGIKTEVVPVNETPKLTLFGLGSGDFQNVLQNMVQGASGIKPVQFRETGYYIAYAPVPVIGYSLGLIAPSAELDQAYVETRQEVANAARSNLYLYIIVLSFVILAAVAVGVVMSRSISTPLMQLTDVATEVSKGNLSTKANIHTRDEIGTLASVFNEMTSQLQETLQGLEERVAARTRDLAIVAEVGTATATILESHRLLEEVVELTKERFHLYHSHIYLLDEKGENLVLTAGAGEAGRIMVSEGRSIPLDREQSLVARAARERKGVTVNDVTQAPDFLPNPLLPDTRSELAVPMIVGDRVIGVFDIQSEHVGRFTDSDVNIQTTLAAQLAVSIQNVRSFEQARTQAEIESLANAIGQKIQRSASVEDTLQTAVRELGMAIGAARVKVNIQAGRQS